MKGDKALIDILNKLLANEFAAINQYTLHASVCTDWGYSKLASKYKEESAEETEDAGKIIERILFLEGSPNVSNVPPIKPGESVKDQFELNLKLELNNLNDLYAGVDICNSVKDHATRHMFEHIILHEQEHADWFETQLQLIRDMGIDNYLANSI